MSCGNTETGRKEKLFSSPKSYLKPILSYKDLKPHKHLPHHFPRPNDPPTPSFSVRPI